MIVYIAEYSQYGTPSLARVPVTKETELFYWLDRDKLEKLFGWTFINKTVKKADTFPTAQLALEYIVREHENYLARLDKEKADAIKGMAVVLELLAQIEQRPAERGEGERG